MIGIIRAGRLTLNSDERQRRCFWLIMNTWFRSAQSDQIFAQAPIYQIIKMPHRPFIVIVKGYFRDWIELDGVHGVDADDGETRTTRRTTDGTNE